jgi:hypothetical protein
LLQLAQTGGEGNGSPDSTESREGCPPAEPTMKVAHSRGPR